MRFLIGLGVAAIASSSGCSGSSCTELGGRTPDDYCLSDAGSLRATLATTSTDMTCTLGTDGGQAFIAMYGTQCFSCPIGASCGALPEVSVDCDVSALPDGSYRVAHRSGPRTLQIPLFANDGGVPACR